MKIQSGNKYYYWGRAGYFGKIVLMIARTLSMSMEVSDCGTKHLIPYEIKTKKHLKKLNGKYYKLSMDDYDYSLFICELLSHP